MDKMRQVDAKPVSVLDTYPKVSESEVDALLKKEIEADDSRIIVLDDDPTGVQTVHDIYVYTDWSVENLKEGLLGSNKVFYILTNSRGFTADETKKVHEEIARNIKQAAAETKVPYVLISRSDSTLRGHFPLETKVLREGLEEAASPFDGEILVPFFKEGGRFTIENVHYVKDGEQLTPAGQTEFAKDKTFGYQASDMRDYIEEKTKGEYKAEEVVCISLEDLRTMRVDKIKGQLLQVNGFGKVIVNAIDYCDIKVFCIALYRAMKEGKHFMFRCAAGLVKVMGGITDKPLLTRDEMVLPKNENGGMIVIGSHTNKTTAQMEALKDLNGIEFVEFNSDLVLDEKLFEDEIQRVVTLCEETMKTGSSVAVYTKRRLLTVENDTKEDALIRSVKISDGVQSLVGRLSIVPGFLIAKGGITSSDVGTKALKVKKALVLGQIQPGIPVWKTGEESKFPGVSYVIFPGNVGDDKTLLRAVEILMKK